MNVENYIESQYRLISDYKDIEYLDLYSNISPTKLKEIFSTLHHEFVTLFKSMNSRLPTNDYGAHFWADQSRKLIQVIDITRGLERVLKSTSMAFSLDEYYDKLLNSCSQFLSESGGSQIPPNMEKIELYYTIPIFATSSIISISNIASNLYANLKQIGNGSYANVYKFKDLFYDNFFVLKRAKKDLNSKELERFEREYSQLKKFSSPYIVSVYNYDADKHEYIMEYMDYSLDKYIEKYNSQLTFSQRKNLGFQILKGFTYIHSKDLLHRDISPKNILLKEYDDLVIAKIADFGLVKIPDSDLTSVNTEFKGYFNDPSLITEGFNNYSILHETFALTRLLYFVLTGKTNIDNISSQSLKTFVLKGLNSSKNLRFQNLNELQNEYKTIQEN